jgi:hypothetical protein
MGECFRGCGPVFARTLGLALVAPGNTVQDINDSVQGQELSGERLVPQTTSMGPKEHGLEFSIRMSIFQGVEDFTTPTTLARHYEGFIKAQQKAFVPPWRWTLRRVSF